jgi:serine/threonine protein phosphatase PrpC
LTVPPAEGRDRRDHAAGYAARSDVGLARTGNEDGFLARPPLFVVADGMGGHRAGEVASALAVRLVGEALPGPTAAVPTAIVAAVEAANAAVWSEARGSAELSGMGTTCTIAVVDGARAHIAHVGDSRAYLLRGDVLEQLTSDHTLIASMVREGILSDDDARDDDRRHIITRAVGAESEVRVDLSTHDLQPGDRLLLCSDGLSGQVDDAVISGVLAGEPDPGRAVDRLIDLANAAGGVDNVTAIVIDPDRLMAGPAADRTTVIEADPQRGETTVIGPSIHLGPKASAPVPASPRVEPRRRTDRWRPVAFLLAAVLVGLLALAGARAFGPTEVGSSPTPSLSPSPSVRAPTSLPSDGPGQGTAVPGVGGDDSPSPAGRPDLGTPSSTSR